MHSDPSKKEPIIKTLLQIHIQIGDYRKYFRSFRRKVFSYQRYILKNTSSRPCFPWNNLSVFESGIILIIKYVLPFVLLKKPPVFNCKAYTILFIQFRVIISIILINDYLFKHLFKLHIIFFNKQL